jgi:tetratricopeptide (TPR) repeat protein
MRIQFLFLFLLLLQTLASAQSVDLPLKSPAASTALTIGYTHISVDYSAPSVLDREIWGGLVPYDTLWRAGANAATTIGFSTDVRINGQPLKAGKYALLALPRKDSTWTVIFNRNTSLRGTNGYQPEQDALRVDIRPKFARTRHQEILQYEIVRQNIENGYILLSWEKLRLYLPVKVETMDRAIAEIEEALAATPDEGEWEVYLQAADFLFWSGAVNPARTYAQKSVGHKPTAAGYWLLARINAKQEAYQAALEATSEALKLADDGFNARYGTTIRKKQADWKEERP